MAVAAGTRLGPYEILAPIGEGGMGQVWLARDSKLNREVAVKVLPESFASDPDRLARFTREAQVLASLNHRNIAAIYGVEEHAIVMELVKGKDLRGPLPVEAVIQYARQIAEALEAAHEKGVVHRDLKPTNIRITPDGLVKVLDFGLARRESAVPGEASPEDHTVSMTTTQPGMILGTAAYMSPEQVRGETAGAPADIWSFGVVLYEMLTGERPFQGKTISETMAAVLKDEPDFSRIPSTMQGLLRSCLRKDTKGRLRNIADAHLLLDAGMESPAVAGAQAGLRARTWFGAATAGIALMAAAAGFTWWRGRQTAERPLMRFTDDLGSVISLASNTGPPLAISRDGLHLAYISLDSRGDAHLSVRSIASGKSVVLAGTEGASAPFFSPDGRWIGFVANQNLRKIAVDGGGAMTLCEAANFRGGDWSEGDEIILAASARSPLTVIPARGGTPRVATELDRQKGESTHRYPQFLPGGEAFLFTSSPDNNNYDAATVEIQSTKSGKRKTLAEGFFGRYLEGGYLIYIHGTTLFGRSMDLGRWELTGPPTPILDDVSVNFAGQAQLTSAANGTIAYIAGSTLSQQSVAWLNATGTAERLPLESGRYSYPRSSPDGTRIALRITQSSGTNLAVYEWAAQRMTQLTFLKGSVGTHPTWTPDSKHVILPIDSQELAGPGIYWMRADGVGEPQRLLEGRHLATYSVSPDGKRIAYFRQSPGYEIGILPLDLADPEHPKAGKPETFLESKSDLRVPSFSPDGRWIAYISNESDTPGLYVRPYPLTNAGSGRWSVATGGINTPYWSRTGNELFYQAIDGRIWATTYTVQGDSFAPDKPRVWSPKLPPIQVNQLALVPDGKRFVGLIPSSSEPQTHVTYLLNFSDELRRRIPRK